MDHGDDLWLSLFAEPPVELGANGRSTGVELELPEDETDRVSTPPLLEPDSVGIETHSLPLERLLSRLREGTIDLAPDFHRRAGVWSDLQQSRLIESLLLRIPVSSFFMAQQEDDTWSVVDGIQRLSAVARFMAPDAVGMRPLRLSGLDYLRHFHGMGHQDLPGRLRIRLRETQVGVHLVRHGTPETVKFNVFSRVNTGGPPLSRQEIRHAMIPGPARDFLADLAEDPAFGEATDWSVSNERMADREMVLRFLAFRLSPPAEYRQQDFDQFLADAMHRLNELTSEQLAWEARQFREAMKCARTVFGEQAFRKRYPGVPQAPVNKALFEAVAVNLALLRDEQREELVASRDAVHERFFELMHDFDFERSVSIGTGEPTKVRTRFAAVEKLFRGVLSGD